MCALRFVPREEKFFEFFSEQARILREAAQLLSDGISKGGETMIRNAELLANLEKQGDHVYRTTYEKLRTTFITPFDPEDIYTLSSKLEDAIDGTEETGRLIVAYTPSHTSPGITSLTDLLVKAALEIEKAFSLLKSGGDVQPHCLAVRTIEEESDKAMVSGLVDLFTRESDPIEVIKVKGIIELIEDTIDFCDDVGDVLTNMVVKNS
ncbi:MAG: DUF47 family protein [Bryobacterales bacterium]|nr:DUF47 family protein [Bryobacterales bacterium]